jgi:hypothetical protein
VDAFFGTRLPTFTTEANALQTDVTDKQVTASNAATTATAKASEALTSANNAATSKTGADSARDAAVVAKNAAEAALDSFDDRYLGAKATAPTADNDGAALLTGALYWDTALPGMRSWNGAAWVTLPAATAAAISNTPAGSIAATTVQAAINELDSEKLAKAGGVMTGDLSIPSLNGGPLAGTRNFLINGCMRVAQRGNVEFTGTNNLYGGADRWLTSISGTTVSAVALQAEYAGSRSGYAHQIGNLTTTGATTAAISQRIEALNSRALNGKTVTFSGKVLQQTGAARTLTRSTTKANAKDNFEGGQTTLSSNTVDVPNNVVTPFIFTFSLGAADGNNGISMLVGFNALPAMSSAQLYFFDMQLEVGETATPLEYRSIGMEEALCRRYYCRQAFYIGAIYNTVANTEWGASVQWPVPMRATPTVYVIGGAAGAGSSNPTIDTPSSTNARVTFVAGPAGAVAQASGNAVASSEI